jgi:hypothetical protein
MLSMFLLVLLCILSYIVSSFKTTTTSLLSSSSLSSSSLLCNRYHNTINTINRKRISMFIDDAISVSSLSSSLSSLSSLSTLVTTDAMPLPLSSITSTVIDKAISGGKSGALAGSLQVLSLMWLRTTLNYQYRYGTTTSDALSTLYKEGGIPRLYQGLPFALIQGPLSRFGDTAANTLIVTAIDLTNSQIPTFISTLMASLLAGGWRILLMPVDTVKTSMQVNGESGFNIIQERIKERGWTSLYAGALAASAATVVGHYPWFLTFNYLSDILPTSADIINYGNNGDEFYKQLSVLDGRLITLLRSAFIGLSASSVSDICSNSLRVLKTTRQTDIEITNYIDSAKSIISKEGLSGLFGRGLQTRLLANSLQSILFSVLFKFFQQSQK